VVYFGSKRTLYLKIIEVAVGDISEGLGRDLRPDRISAH
jgi:hypothetical protein